MDWSLQNYNTSTCRSYSSMFQMCKSHQTYHRTVTDSFLKTMDFEHARSEIEMARVLHCNCHVMVFAEELKHEVIPHVSKCLPTNHLLIENFRPIDLVDLRAIYLIDLSIPIMTKESSTTCATILK